MTLKLSNREKQILPYLADGCSNKEIANEFCLTEQTVKNHVTMILTKLNAKNRAHAVAIYLRGVYGDMPDSKRERLKEKLKEFNQILED